MNRTGLQIIPFKINGTKILWLDCANFTSESIKTGCLPVTAVIQGYICALSLCRAKSWKLLKIAFTEA